MSACVRPWQCPCLPAVGIIVTAEHHAGTSASFHGIPLHSAWVLPLSPSPLLTLIPQLRKSSEMGTDLLKVWAAGPLQSWV